MIKIEKLEKILQTAIGKEKMMIFEALRSWGKRKVWLEVELGRGTCLECAALIRHFRLILAPINTS